MTGVGWGGAVGWFTYMLGADVIEKPSFKKL